MLHHWRGIHIKYGSRFFSFSPTCKKKNKTRAFPSTLAEPGCLSRHGLTAARETRCYIYLKACQVFALILAYLQEGMRSKNTALFWKR